MLKANLTRLWHFVLLFVLVLVTGLHPGLYPQSTLFAADVEVSDNEPVTPGAHDPTLFGVQMYGTTESDSKYSPFLVDSKADWLRVHVYWSHAEPENVSPDKYNWAESDATVAAATYVDIQIILEVDFAPVWAATHPRGPIDLVDISEFTTFLGALAERYDGDGVDDAPQSPVANYIELYNEPDAGCNPTSITAVGWGRHGDQYAAMLKAAYPVIKAANPNAQIVMGGIAHDWLKRKSDCLGAPGWPINNGPFVEEFLDDVLVACYGAPAQKNASDTAEVCFDVMNFHYYSDFAPNWQQFPDVNGLSVGMYEKTNYLRNKLAQYGVGDKPIIVTEASKHTNGEPGDLSATPTMQAQHVPVYYAQAKAAGVSSVIWWPLFDLSLLDYPYQTGLVTAGDPTPEKKIAFGAYTTAIEQIGKTEFVRVLPPEETGLPLKGFPTMEVYQFRRQSTGREVGDSVYVAWLNPMWDLSIAAGRPLKLGATKATLRDIFGNVTGTVNDSDDGTKDNRVTINVTGKPVYIEVAKAHEARYLFLSLVSR